MEQTVRFASTGFATEPSVQKAAKSFLALLKAQRDLPLTQDCTAIVHTIKTGNEINHSQN